MALTVGGCGGSGQQSTTDVAQIAPVTSAPAEPEQTPAAEEPTATPKAATTTAAAPKPTRSPAAKPTPTPTKKARPAPSRKPVADKPPPMRKPEAKPGCAEKFVGKPAKRAEVRAALTEAAGRTYWPVSAPDLTVPVELVKAVAWQESTWRSNVHSCDGGVGLMQVMPDTADYVNNRFEKAYDRNVYTDNAVLGANYLAWLLKYFGDAYFEGNYDATAADCASTTDPCLLNMVISGYNFGPGAVDKAMADKKALPNPGYVKNVRRLMTECECLRF